jgi:hypothetical protein
VKEIKEWRRRETLIGRTNKRDRKGMRKEAVTGKVK